MVKCASARTAIPSAPARAMVKRRARRFSRADVFTCSPLTRSDHWSGPLNGPLQFNGGFGRYPVAFGFLCETIFGTGFGLNGALAVTGAVSCAVTVLSPAVPVATATLSKLAWTFGRVQV